MERNATGKWLRQWIYPSESNPKRSYTISEPKDSSEPWACSCTGWTQHTPRTDCKHIRGVKANDGLGRLITDAIMDRLKGMNINRT